MDDLIDIIGGFLADALLVIPIGYVAACLLFDRDAGDEPERDDEIDEMWRDLGGEAGEGS